MLPLQQAYEVKQSIIEYLKATFSFKEKVVSDAFYSFIEHPKDGIFKGPYVSLKLPFETSEDDEKMPLEIAPNFPPYKHQFEAFKRLHTKNNHIPQPTLLTTGTGSGKTESFLFPILDYCYKHRNERGIKVIILYPMNALATDQAKRLAEAIYEDERLRGVVTAGLFIGEGKDKGKYPKQMGATHIIENRDEIVSNPPDILLTNFKMLDYGLMRHNFHPLWSHNFDDPELLRFLVLDELHTYDGAQGTDVANLIRRLKLKLNTPKGHLCPIGTSATIGKGEDSVQLLTEYASNVFGEKFSSDSVIIEHRLSSNQFFTVTDEELDTFIPRIVGLKQSRLGTNENYEDYILRQKKLWQLPENISSYELSIELKKLKVVKDVCSISSKHIISITELIGKVEVLNPEFKKLPQYEHDGRFSPKEEVITSLLALIAEAKTDKKGRFPFLFLQIQIWVRELSGLLREFNEEPKFTWRDKIAGKEENAALPPYYCRECGASGWLAIKHDNRNQFELDPLEVYEYFFTNHKNIYFTNTYKEAHFGIDDYDPSTTIAPYVHQVDLKHMDHITDQRMHMIAYRKVKDQKNIHTCPECNSVNDLSIIGTRIATLNSVSISQILSSDLDERSDKYRKVLAFSNGVQDAAHQAGFVEARNYRFTFRASLQKVINQIGKPVDIETLKNAFIDYWKSNADPSEINHLEAYFYRFFPSDYIGKARVEDYRNLTTNLFSKGFEKEFDTRVHWEILTEFGYNAAIGRTLEKTGSSAVSFNKEVLETTFDSLHDWMKNNMLETIEKDQFVKFLNGILHRMRMRGAINHEYLSKFRTDDLKLWDLNWMRDTRHYLNRNFGPKSRIPKLVCTTSHTRGVLDTTFAKTTNWFHAYFSKNFQMAPANNAIINEFYEILFEQLVTCNLLSAQKSKDGINYAIIPETLLVSNKATTYQCDTCSSTIHVTEQDEMPEDSSCLGYRCFGHYKKSEGIELNYYNLVYNRTKSPRIYAAEHTGVLERKDREKTEYDFKERPKYNSLNTLVATSTLEMGIDVGSLNTAINTSVPPLPSNFLQRVGRAGRSSGTALIENFAQNKAHDLYYYEEPLEMMEGDIATPGCFLNAKDILVRHFTAYCFDSWTKDDPERNQIPGLIKTLNLLNIKTTDTSFFINQLLDYVLEHQKILFSKFVDVYDDQIEPQLMESIKTSLKQGAFQQKLIGVFENIREELFFLIKKEKEIEQYILDKGLGKEDDERKLLDQEKKSLWQLKKSLELRQVIEHLTNEGILPNYAFPETGVTLSAHVYGFKPEGAEQEPENKSYEIVRSAAGALKEYAPDNFFYSQGNKLEISGLNTYDWSGQKSSLITMRFCANCDHLEEDVKATKGACPKCEHESWGSASNKHKFAKLHAVKSINSRNKSALNDSKDEREQKNYRISTHFKFNSNTIEGTWGMVNIPFGIEYVKDVELTQVNLGAGIPNSNHLTINKIEEVARHGFVTCKHCGKSTSKPREVQQFDNKKFHYGYCKHKEVQYNNIPNDIFEEVFLYRNVRTEAIKIILPVQEFLNEATQQMFKAGLELGLKKYYKGNPDHVAFEFYSEFNKANDRFDRYLIMYDTVPGGTGYLQKLFDPKEFTTLLNEAYIAIRDCNCKHSGKDGCYRCILSYGNQYIRKDLSRASAEDLFGKIVSSANDWEEINQGISSLTKTGMIEESELELKFIYSIKKYVDSQTNTKYSFQEFKENGINNYRIGLPIKDGKITYQIRPQVNLGQKDLLDVDTRTDFYIKCIQLERSGEVIDDLDELTAYKDIAIYLDGYTYHASEKHMRFYKDLVIRDSINATPNISSWSLSWTDVTTFESEIDENKIDELFVKKNSYSNSISRLKTLPAATILTTDLLEAKNSIERLLWYLMNSSSHYLEAEIGLLVLSFQESFAKNSYSVINAEKFVDGDISVETENTNADSYLLSELTQANELFKLRILGKLKNFNVISKFEIEQLDSIDKVMWERFLRLYSLLKLIK
jgi:DEAD/DEAH box helicase domain-containing protein